MNRKKIFHPASRLISRKLTGTITSREAEELQLWERKSAENVRTIDKIRENFEGPDEKPYMRSGEIDRAWLRLSRRLGRRPLRSAVWRYAAVAAVVVGIGIFMLSRTMNDDTQAAITVVQLPETALPQYTSPDGRVTRIEAGPGFWVPESEQPQTASGDGEPIYASITVPRGTTLRTVICGNIGVTFNAGSELRYQVNPTDGVRKAYIKGEVFFDIDSPLETPLLVYPSEELCIRVLGTSFNVSAYENRDAVTTTLVRGKLRIEGTNVQTILEPSEQLVYDRRDASVSKRKVNTEPYVAWTQGRFVFRNEPLSTIMERIGRWYNVDIAVSDPSVLENRFSGDLEWYDRLDTLLQMLEKVTGIKINIESRNSGTPQ